MTVVLSRGAVQRFRWIRIVSKIVRMCSLKRVNDLSESEYFRYQNYLCLHNYYVIVELTLLYLDVKL